MEDQSGEVDNIQTQITRTGMERGDHLLPIHETPTASRTLYRSSTLKLNGSKTHSKGNSLDPKLDVTPKIVSYAEYGKLLRPHKSSPELNSQKKCKCKDENDDISSGHPTSFRVSGSTSSISLDIAPAFSKENGINFNITFPVMKRPHKCNCSHPEVQEVEEVVKVRDAGVQTELVKKETSNEQSQEFHKQQQTSKNTREIGTQTETICEASTSTTGDSHKLIMARELRRKAAEYRKLRLISAARNSNRNAADLFIQFYNNKREKGVIYLNELLLDEMKDLLTNRIERMFRNDRIAIKAVTVVLGDSEIEANQYRESVRDFIENELRFPCVTDDVYKKTRLSVRLKRIRE